MIVFRNLHLALLLTLVLGLGVLGSMWQAQQEETRRQKELRMVVQAVAALINTMDSQEWDNCLAAMKNDSCRIVQNVLQGICTELEGCSRALLLAYTPSNGRILCQAETSKANAEWNRRIQTRLVPALHNQTWQQLDPASVIPIRQNGAAWVAGCAPIRQELPDGEQLAVIVVLSDGPYYASLRLHSMTLFMTALAVSIMICISWFFTQRLQRSGAELSAARERADAANLAKSQFLNVMGHELRTPLNPVVGYASMLKHDIPEGSQEYECIRQIETSGNEMLTVIQKLLSIAAMDLNQLQPHPVATTLKIVQDHICSYAKPLAEGKSVDFSSTINGADAVFSVDLGLLEQALRHLIANSIKFTSAGGYIRLQIELHLNQAGRSYLNAELCNNGSPVPPEWVDRLFEPFAKGGSGVYNMRLAVARNMLRQLGGDVTHYLSEKGETCFLVYVPAISSQG